ncbi:glycosyltransferase [Allochromatium palmeri]|uniref:Glycosyltransferase n=2 Tax=Allochromatium palmeri TaxID=231048 RepID=A0A6N8EAG5_9GAMM|nr:glycosyltransferase [Allochromatium palmeri]
MLHVLRTEGVAVLLRKLRRRLHIRPLDSRGPPTLFALEEPFAPIAVPCHAAPCVSIVIAIQRPLRAIHHCLAALSSAETQTAFEVILVAATLDDRTRRLAGYPGARLIQTPLNTTDAPPRLANLLNQGAQRARGDWIVFLGDDTQVQSGWLDVLVQSFTETPAAGLLGSRLLYPDGRQREAGRRLDADGRAHALGDLDDPDQPANGYRRAVDVCSLAALAIRADLFRLLGGFDSTLVTSSDLAIDLAQRVRAEGLGVYCQPLSRVVQCAPDDENRDESKPRARPLAHTMTVEASQRVLVVDSYMVTPDRESGSLRMLNLFRILQGLGYQVTFAAANLEAPPPYVADLQRQGFEVLYRPYVRSIACHLASEGKRYDLVLLSRADAAAQVMPAARRHCPRARIIFDTVDLHFLREQRLAELLGDRGTRLLAEARKRQELDLMRRADLTLVVSEAERALLAAEAPDVEVRVVSNIHHIFGSANPPEARRDILFIGAFSHPPNRDAVLFFCDAVMPQLRARLPALRLKVIGSDPPAEVLARAGDEVGVDVLGYVPNVEPFFAGCMLSVAPLRYGAGVKGKINQSLAHGLPVVATGLAVEGMHLVDGESVLIADTAEAMAEAVIRLHQDRNLWQRLSAGGLEVMERHFSFAAAERAVRAALAPESSA